MTKAVLKRLENYSEDRATGCWIWNGYVDPFTGYGQITDSSSKSRGAHRVAYQMWVGRIPKGKLVCHCCDRRTCIRPDHLFLGTYKENYADAKKKKRHSHGDKHGCRKLSENDVRSILDELSAGETQTEVAMRFGVSQAQIWRIQHKKSWQHIL